MMKQSKLLIVIFLLCILSSCTSTDPSEIKAYSQTLGTDVSKETLDEYLQAKMKALAIPGLSIAVINDGKIVHHKTLRYADRDQKLLVTSKTIFEGASMSRSLFSFL